MQVTADPESVKQQTNLYGTNNKNLKPPVFKFRKQPNLRRPLSQRIIQTLELAGAISEW